MTEAQTVPAKMRFTMYYTDPDFKTSLNLPDNNYHNFSHYLGQTTTRTVCMNCIETGLQSSFCSLYFEKALLKFNECIVPIKHCMK